MTNFDPRSGKTSKQSQVSPSQGGNQTQVTPVTKGKKGSDNFRTIATCLVVGILLLGVGVWVSYNIGVTAGVNSTQRQCTGGPDQFKEFDLGRPAGKSALHFFVNNKGRLELDEWMLLNDGTHKTIPLVDVTRPVDSKACLEIKIGRKVTNKKVELPDVLLTVYQDDRAVNQVIFVLRGPNDPLTFLNDNDQL